MWGAIHNLVARWLITSCRTCLKRQSMHRLFVPGAVYETPDWSNLNINIRLLYFVSRWLLVAVLSTLLTFGLASWAAPSQIVLAQSEPGISSPEAGAEVTGVMPIMGTAVIEPFQRYELFIKQEPNGDDAYIYFAGGTQPVVGGQLGLLDANTFAPGVYTIRLRVVKLDGNYAEYFAPNISINQGPPPTPTSNLPTPTPIPTATFTPAPQPTPIVGEVTQPELLDDVISNTATPEPVVVTAPDSGSGSVEENNAPSSGSGAADVQELNPSGLTQQLGAAIGLQRLRMQFINGMRYSAIIFVLVGLLFATKGVVHWIRRQA